MRFLPSRVLPLPSSVKSAPKATVVVPPPDCVPPESFSSSEMARLPEPFKVPAATSKLPAAMFDPSMVTVPLLRLVNPRPVILALFCRTKVPSPMLISAPASTFMLLSLDPPPVNLSIPVDTSTVLLLTNGVSMVVVPLPDDLVNVPSLSNNVARAEPDLSNVTLP